MPKTLTHRKATSATVASWLVPLAVTSTAEFLRVFFARAEQGIPGAAPATMFVALNSTSESAP